jgi:hypothetical protein
MLAVEILDRHVSDGLGELDESRRQAFFLLELVVVQVGLEEGDHLVVFFLHSIDHHPNVMGVASVDLGGIAISSAGLASKVSQDLALSGRSPVTASGALLRRL